MCVPELLTLKFHYTVVHIIFHGQTNLFIFLQYGIFFKLCHQIRPNIKTKEHT